MFKMVNQDPTFQVVSSLTTRIRTKKRKMCHHGRGASLDWLQRSFAGSLGPDTTVFDQGYSVCGPQNDASAEPYNPERTTAPVLLLSDSIFLGGLSVDLHELSSICTVLHVRDLYLKHAPFIGLEFFPWWYVYRSIIYNHWTCNWLMIWTPATVTFQELSSRVGQKHAFGGKKTEGRGEVPQINQVDDNACAIPNI